MSSLGSPSDGTGRPWARLAVLALFVIVLASANATVVAAQTDGETAEGRQILPDPEPEDPDETTTTTALLTTTTTTEPVDSTTTSTPRRRSTSTTSAGEIDGFDDEDDVEDTTTTSTSSTTVPELLVPGDGTEGSESTTTTSTTVVEVSSAGVDDISESTVIWLIVAGLVTIAVLISLWTWRFWKATRPAPPVRSSAAPRRDETTVFRSR